MSTDASQSKLDPSTPISLSPLLQNRRRVGVGLLVLILALLSGIFLYRSLSQTKTLPVLDDTNSTETMVIPDNPMTHLGVVIRNAEGTALPVKQELDQEKLNAAVRTAWEEALIKGSTNVAGFPNDPDLIAFRFTPTGASEPISLVIYKTRAIIIDAQPVASLPKNAKSRINLSSEKNQVVAKYEYTPAITKLDVPAVLTEVFSLAMSGNRTTPQAKSIPPVEAFQEVGE